MQMKKVLVLISTKFVTYGGLTNAFMNYYRNMDKTDLIIDVASTLDADEVLIKEIECNGGKYIALPDKRKNIIKYIKKFNFVCRGYDVIHVNGNSATMGLELMIAKKNKIPVRIAHCHSTKTSFPLYNFILTPIFNKSYTNGLAVSDMAGWVYGKRKFRVLNNAIDTSKYAYNEQQRAKIRKQYGISDFDLVLGHVGKIYEAKNHKFLIQLFHELSKNEKNVKLLIVGDGILRSEIEDEIDKYNLNDRVIITGMQNETAPFYSAIDLFLFPSIFEGFGLAILEAQASGLNVLASEAVPRMVDIAKCVTFLPLNIERWLSEALKKISDSEATNRILTSNNNIKKIIDKNYDIKKCSNELRKIYISKN